MKKKDLLLYLAGMKGAQEAFDFRENLQATVGKPDAVQTVSVAKHRPVPGTAVIEILDADGKILMVDTIKAAPAPKLVRGATYVRVGMTGYGHQELTASLTGTHPFKLPQHMREKEHDGGVSIRAWWSCEKEGT